MKALSFLITLFILTGYSCTTEDKNPQNPIKVELIKQGDKYQLYRDGKPYRIRGAGTEMHLIPELAASGANSARSWSTVTDHYTADEFLDLAYAHGLTVTLGLDVLKERKGFDYNDTAAVREQLDYMREEVLKYKDHPALLAWGIGNELNLNHTNLKVWDAVNDIAKMIKEVDPNHPTTTMLAGIIRSDVEEIARRAPELDFLSIQMYGDLPNLQQRIKESGYNGPYIVSEWGATGHWEVARTEWDAPIEQTSREKAESYIHRYKVAIEADSMHCLGSYVFFWGQKQERTPTWYGLYTENGMQTETIDAMYKIWNGNWPENRAPRLDSLHLNGKTALDNVRLEKAKTYTAKAYFTNFENDSLSFHWEILPESTDLGVGGDRESRPESINHLVLKGDTETAEILAPEKEGAYRLFVYIDDGHRKVATANIPFYVN